MHRLHAVRGRMPGRGDLRRGRRSRGPAAVQGVECGTREDLETHHRTQAGAARCRRVERRAEQALAVAALNGRGWWFAAAGTRIAGFANGCPPFALSTT